MEGGPDKGVLFGGFTNKDVSVESATNKPQKLGGFELHYATRNAAGKLTAR